MLGRILGRPGSFELVRKMVAFACSSGRANWSPRTRRYAKIWSQMDQEKAHDASCVRVVLSSSIATFRVFAGSRRSSKGHRVLRLGSQKIGLPVSPVRGAAATCPSMAVAWAVVRGRSVRGVVQA